MPPISKFGSASLYDQSFLRYKVAENRKNRKYIEWPQTAIEHLTVKISCIHKVLTPEAQILACFCSMTSRLKDIAHFIIPHSLHVKWQKKWKKKKRKIAKTFKISNFTILFTTSETLPRSIHALGRAHLGLHLVYTFRGDVVWNFYSHIVPC